MKKFAKSVSILMVLIVCLTIGGVYATWSYAASAGVSETVNKGVTIAPVTQSGSIGTYEVLYTKFAIVIDQMAEGDYTPKLVLRVESGDGALDFKFTPANVASDEVKANGIESTVSFSSNLAHEGTAIFSFPATITIGKVGSGATFQWVKQEDGSFLCSIPNAELANYIQLNYTAKLDTYAKYQAFEASLANGTISIKIANAAASA